MKKKRSKLDTITDILTILKEYKKVKITHLIYKSNLSSSSIKPYISELKEKKLIEETAVKGKTFFIITENGAQFLNEFAKIKIFAESYGIQDSF